MNMKKNIPLLAAFLVPLLIAIIVCIDHGVFPFGDQCILHVDMYHQYCPFFTEFMEKLKNGGSMFYSWNIGLGADFISLYAYYLASPINWLIILCPQGYVIEFMTILVVLKIALCGLTFAYYLKMHFRTNHFGIAIFGAAYALSAFMAAYAWNIMWTDCMVLAPLVILGLERLIKEGRPFLYYAALSLSILSNYYISIMICIFLVIWFFITLAESNGWHIFKRGCVQNRNTGLLAWVRFALYSLLAGGTGAVLMLPTAIVLQKSGAGGISFPESVEWYFQIIAELSRHFVMTEPYTGAEYWPNLYCGVFVLLFFVLFLLNRNIAWKKRIIYAMFVLFFVVSFANNWLDFFWHGLHFPTSLPGRQSFLYAFLLLVISFEALLHLQENKLWHVTAAGVANGVFLTAVYYFVIRAETDAGGVNQNAFGMTAVLLGCYLTLLLLYLPAREKTRRLILGIGCFAVLGELIANFDMTGLDTTSRTAYTEDWNDYKNVLAEGEKQAAARGEIFYRTEELERKTKNDAALSGYASATQFSSLMNLDVSHFYQAVGMEGGKNFYCVNGATPLLSAMLSIRYVLADNALEENPMRSLVASSGETYLYENHYVLPLGFMMQENVIENWNFKDMGDIGAQNELAYLLGAQTPMLQSLPYSAVSSAPGETVITVEEDGYYYAAYEKTSIGNLTITVSDGRSRNYTKVSHGYTLDLGYCLAGSTIQIENDDNEELSVSAYRLDTAALDAAYHTLCSQTMEMTSFSDTKIMGTIEVKEPGRLVFSIAADEGWTLLVDGKRIEPLTFGDAFLSVFLEEGVHEVELRYETPGIRLGAGISAGCMAMFGLLMLFRHRRKKTWKGNAAVS